jgi:hypothetical protein
MQSNADVTIFVLPPGIAGDEDRYLFSTFATREVGCIKNGRNYHGVAFGRNNIFGYEARNYVCETPRETQKEAMTDARDLMYALRPLGTE